jgi:hypothetical protein
MKRYLTLVVLLVLSLSATARKLQEGGRCIQVAIDAPKVKLSMKKLEKAEVKFKITNCSSDRNFFVDKNTMTEYESKDAVLYFKVYRCEGSNCQPYEYKKVSVSRVSEPSLFEVPSGFSYTYTFQLFELYKILEPGYYKLVGYYHPEPYSTDATLKNYVATSNELEILITP